MELGPGTTIRDIRLVKRLGAGGMGELFVGVQETLGREVAVKVIREDRRLDARAKARFLREARILSRLEHPNICRLYDYIEGEKSDCIVLELVRGRSLRDLLGGPISPARRLSIAEQIAAALIAAHAISVVHRDLKPENIMVADDGIVKVLDFGLARSIQAQGVPLEEAAGPVTDSGPATDHSWTQLGDVMGTPRYLSPEQARGEALTAASDMYVFGLLLQEVWTGRPPYGEGLAASELVQKAMWGEVPPAVGIDPQVADLIRQLTAFESGRRLTAAAAADRLRWIRERPRRRALRRAAAAVSAALVIAALVSSAGFIHARRSQQRAESAQAEAEAVNEFLRSMLASAAPDRQGIDTKVIEVLVGAAATVDEDFADHPLSRAAVHFTLGETYLALGVWPAAHAHLETAAAIRREHLGADDPATLAVEIQVGAALSNGGRQTEAEASLRQTMEACRRILGDDDPLTVSAAASLAVALQRLDRFDEAEPIVRRDVAWKRSNYGDEDDRTLEARGSLANLLARSGHSEEAEAEYRDILEIRRRVGGNDHPDTIGASSNLAALLARNESRAAEAEALLTDVVERRRRVFGPDHPETLRSLDMQAVLLRRLGRTEEAEAMSRQVLERRLATLGPEHPDVIASQMGLALALAKRGEPAEAEELLRVAHAAASATLGENHSLTLKILGNLGNLLVAERRFGEAEAIQRSLLESFCRTLGEGHPASLSAANNLANALIAQGKIEEAAPLVADTLAQERATLGPDHPSTLNALGNHALVLWRQGRLDEAEAAFRELVAASERVFGRDHPRTEQARRDLADLLGPGGQPAGAVTGGSDR